MLAACINLQLVMAALEAAIQCVWSLTRNFRGFTEQPHTGFSPRLSEKRKR
jgi:hypothetical protein